MFEQLKDLIRNDVQDGPAVVVDDLVETFRLYHERPRGLKERLTRPFRRSSYTAFNALDGVSFTVEHGESIGIVGHNGSGKSTLLKVMARILPPDEGHVEVNGRVAALLELGAGFHGDLTGRENIYLNGAVLGLTREEIDEQFDDIVDFAGVRDFIDQPVRNYSSGMYVRLGFAIAVHVDPDILLVDEVLSVGDASFQAKSLEQMASFQQRGKTVVMVSHDLQALRNLCDRVLVLDHGELIFDGPVGEGVKQYSQLMGTIAPGGDRDEGRVGTGDVRITEVGLFDEEEVAVTKIQPSTTLTLRVKVRAGTSVDAGSAAAIYQTGDGTPLYEVHTAWQGLGIGPLAPGQHATVEFRFTAHVLAGHYRIALKLTDRGGRMTYDAPQEPITFEVVPSPGGAGLVDLVAATAVREGPSLRLDDGG